VSESGVYELEGHRFAGEWLATETGDSLSSALSVLETAEQVVRLPELEKAVRSGELSAAQVKELSGAAVVDPAATNELLEAARTENLDGLRRRCAQVRAAKASAEDSQRRARRLHRLRRLRTWHGDDGAFHLEARLTEQAGASVLACLREEADKIFSDRRREGVRESSQAYLADALVALVTRSGEEGGSGPKALAHLRVDLGALQRGNTGPGELCEIAGVGPVSVATARELLGDSITTVLVTSATDVHAVCHLGRTVPARLQSALFERDRCCVVPGCGATRHLEIDHRLIPFAEGGPASLENLARLCHHHHFLKTHEGYALEGGPGAWVWVHPDGRRDGPGPLRPPPTPPPPTPPPPPTSPSFDVPAETGPPPARAYETAAPAQASLFASA
jgi:hypothetical protein